MFKASRCLIFFLCFLGFSLFGLVSNAQTSSASQRAYENYCKEELDRKYPRSRNADETRAARYRECLQTRGQMRSTQDGRLVQAWDPDNPIVKQCEKEFRNNGGNEAVDRCIRSRLNQPKQQAGGCQDHGDCSQTQECIKTQQSRPGKCQEGQKKFENLSVNGGFNTPVCQQCSSSRSARCDYIVFKNKQPVASCSGQVAENQNQQQEGMNGPDPVQAVIAQCKQDEIQGFRGCKDREESAQAKCDTGKDSGINQYIDSMSQMSLQLGTLTSANISAACTNAAALNQGAQAAVIAFRGMCKDKRDTCVNGCQETIKKYEVCVVQRGSQMQLASMGIDRNTLLERARQDQDYQVLRSSFIACNGLRSKIEEADLAAQQFAATIANAKQCGSLTSGGANTFCKQNPTAPGCQGATDCNSPANASSLACICSKNPNDPKCSTRGKIGSGLKVGGGPVEAATNRKGLSDDELGLGGDRFAGRDKNGSDAGTGGSIGEQLGSANVGSNQLQGGDSGAGGAGDGLEAMDVNSGYFAGGGGGSGFGGSSGSVFGSGDGSRSDVNAGFYGTNPDGSGPNLADFLPNGERDPAMINAGSLPDGITGPTTNIWKKINFRYQAVEPTLLNQ